jgi:hypothetical protein
MEAIPEVRFKFIDLLTTSIRFTEILQWELLANHHFSVQILSQNASSTHNHLILCQKLVEQEHQFLSQGIKVFSCLKGNTLPLSSQQDLALCPEYSLLLIPCYYQSVYSGGFLLAHPNRGWVESEILLIQKIVDQYACVQYWMNKVPSSSVYSVHQPSLNIVDILSEALDCHAEPEQSLKTTLRLI